MKGEVAVQEEMGYGFGSFKTEGTSRGPWMPHFSNFSAVRIFP
jgi:hypothetical protein